MKDIFNKELTYIKNPKYRENAKKLKEDQAKIANTDEDAGIKVEVEKVSKDGDKK